jgi:indole-3-glycerol phosphate synthase
VKKASPSKGVIDTYFDYMSIANDYVTGGADCISCLTEPHWFMGSDKIFKDIRGAIDIPMLRKDFTVSEYQVYESKLLGADAVLIIMEALTEKQAASYFDIAETLGICAVFECRDERQIETAQKLGGRIIGVNNRNLKDFSVNLEKAASLRSLVDSNRIFVSESGINSLEDVKAQKLIGADACLIGEFCMRANDRVTLIKEMKNV